MLGRCQFGDDGVASAGRPARGVRPQTRGNQLGALTPNRLPLIAARHGGPLLVVGRPHVPVDQGVPHAGSGRRPRIGRSARLARRCALPPLDATRGAGNLNNHTCGCPDSHFVTVSGAWRAERGRRKADHRGRATGRRMTTSPTTRWITAGPATSNPPGSSNPPGCRNATPAGCSHHR